VEKDKKIVSEKSSGFIDKWKDRNDYLKDPSVLKKALDEYEYLNRNFGTSGNAGFYFELKSSLDQNDPKIKAKFKNIHDFSVKIGIGNFSLFDKDEIKMMFDSLLISAIEFAGKVHKLERNEPAQND